MPKGNFFNPQDSLFMQGYFLGGLPAQMSVMPPFNMGHTIAVDVERIPAPSSPTRRATPPCVGDLAPAGPLVETIMAETIEPRFGTELREIYFVSGTVPAGFTWQTDQTMWSRISTPSFPCRGTSSTC